MQSRMIDTQPNTYAVIFETGDEVTAGLATFVQQRGLRACHFTAIGGFQDVTLGYFDWNRKDYNPIPISEQVEVLSLIGGCAGSRCAEGSRACHRREARWHRARRSSPQRTRQAHAGANPDGSCRRTAQELRPAIETGPD